MDPRQAIKEKLDAAEASISEEELVRRGAMFRLNAALPVPPEEPFWGPVFDTTPTPPPTPSEAPPKSTSYWSQTHSEFDDVAADDDMYADILTPGAISAAAKKVLPTFGQSRPAIKTLAQDERTMREAMTRLEEAMVTLESLVAADARRRDGEHAAQVMALETELKQVKERLQRMEMAIGMDVDVGPKSTGTQDEKAALDAAIAASLDDAMDLSMG
jgi:hypothetical protein